MKNEQERLEAELAHIRRLREVSSQSPEIVAKLQEQEGQFKHALAARARWHKEHLEARCSADQTRKVLRALPRVVEERDLAFDRFSVFRDGVNEGNVRHLVSYQSQTDAMKTVAATADERIKSADAIVSRAKRFFQDADDLARLLAGQIDAAKSELRRLVNMSAVNAYDARVADELRWLHRSTQVPELAE